LPKDWVNLAEVKQGDTVYLEYGKNNSLRILSENLIKKEEKLKEYHINCDLSLEPNLLERLIVGSYVLGTDLIKISSSTRICSKKMEEIRNIVRRLVGLSIIEASKEEMILQCSLDPSKLEIYPLIQRLSVISMTMLNEAMQALLELNPELANDVIKREHEANSIYWLITRLLLPAQKSQTLAETIGLTDYLGPTGVRLVSKNFEGVSDCSKGIAKIVLELNDIKNEINKEELEKISYLDCLTRKMYQKAADSLFSRDIIGANEAINMRIQLGKEIEARMRRAAIPYFRAIAIMLAIIGERSGSIATVIINREIWKCNSFPAQIGRAHV